MTEADRIRLAHAINEGQELDKVNVALFDPENDANDDYAVLEWMRSFFAQVHDDLPDGGYLVWFDFKREYQASNNPLTYQIGDYARAALKALDNE